MAYFTEDLIVSIKNRSLAPISQNTFSDSDLLLLAYEEMELKLLSDLVKAREDFFLTSELVSIQSGNARYSVPSRAIGESIKALFYLESGIERKLQKIDISESYKWYGQTGSPSVFAFEGSEVVIFPTPSNSAGQLDFKFAAKPNKLVLSTYCGAITSVSNDTTNASFVVNTDLTASLSVGAYVDFISVRSPFKTYVYRLPILQITSNQIDVSLSGVVNGAGTIKPQVGDYICPSESSNIPQIPTAFHPVLAQMTAVRLLESLGDAKKLAAARATQEQMRTEALSLVRNRVESLPEKIRPKKNLNAYFR